jgi:hypothetical protein
MTSSSVSSPFSISPPPCHKSMCHLLELLWQAEASDYLTTSSNALAPSLVP